MKKFLKNFLRGYSDEDLEYAKNILANRDTRPVGYKLEVTGRQFRALLSLQCMQKAPVKLESATTNEIVNNKIERMKWIELRVPESKLQEVADHLAKIGIIYDQSL